MIAGKIYREFTCWIISTSGPPSCCFVNSSISASRRSFWTWYRCHEVYGWQHVIVHTSVLLRFFSPAMAIMFRISSFVLSIEVDSSFRSLMTLVFSSCFIVAFPFSIFDMSDFCCSMRPSSRSFEIEKSFNLPWKNQSVTYSFGLENSSLLSHHNLPFLLCFLQQFIFGLQHLLVLLNGQHFLGLHFFRLLWVKLQSVWYFNEVTLLCYLAYLCLLLVITDCSAKFSLVLSHAVTQTILHISFLRMPEHLDESK